jgi:NAD(P)-dependent dehydrogenase (short-subunit alcohol dehydrogenase family)
VRRRRTFCGQVVVVTGAASGIGRATAEAFAVEGARVHLADIAREPLWGVATALAERGLGVQAHVVDCTVPEQMHSLAAEVVRAEGRVDILHNNAGVCCGGPVERTSLEDWRWTLDVNLWGVIHGLDAFLPKLLAQPEGGTIINTASMGGLVGLPFIAPYCASKFAVVGLSEALAAELGPRGIRVVVVCPGMVQTGILQNARLALPGDWNRRVEWIFERLASSPEQVAAEILRAVEKRRTLVLLGGAMQPLWWLKRGSWALSLGLGRILGRLGRPG